MAPTARCTEMTSLVLHPEESTRASLVSQIACCVEDLAVLVGNGCLVESAASRLVAHHFVDPDVPSALVSALVTGELGPLHRDLSSRRATGLLPSGAVVEGVVADRRVAYLALRVGDSPVGGVWLLPADDRALSLEELTDPVQRLTSLLSCAGPEGDEPSLATCLETGGDLPACLAGRERWWVARVDAALAAESLLRALPSATSPVVLRPVRCGSHVYLVVGGSRRVSAQHALAAVRAAVSGLDVPVTAALSETCDAAGLPAARRQADAAIQATVPGTCTALASVRSAVIVQHLGKALRPLPDLGPDPLRRLLDYDRRRGANLADTLVVWLNAFGDVPSTTTDLAIHPNTLRYRLKRIDEITGLNLRHDPLARLELHLRLLTRVSQETA